MNYSIWNVRTGNNAKFKRCYESMVQLYRAAMLETKILTINNFSDELHFEYHIQFSIIGHIGGIVSM